MEIAGLLSWEVELGTVIELELGRQLVGAELGTAVPELGLVVGLVPELGRLVELVT